MVFITFLQEKTVNFSYSGNTCVRQLVLFPDLNKITDDNLNFDLKNDSNFKIGKFTILLNNCDLTYGFIISNSYHLYYYHN